MPGTCPEAGTADPAPPKWTPSKVRDLVQQLLGKRACWWQIKVALALYAGKDVIGVAPTGAGKTLSFWIALLMIIEDGATDRMVVVVTPLNLLGKQNEKSLAVAGVPSLAMTKENNRAETWKDVADGKYRAITLSPELLTDTQFSSLLDKSSFTDKLLYFVFDEGHCIKLWSSFRNQYLHVGNIRHLLPNRIPFYVASATLPPHVRTQVSLILRLRTEKQEEVILSNDRPNIAIAVREMEHAVNSYHDLAFLILSDLKVGDHPPPKFLVFFSSTTIAEDACAYLQTRLPAALRDKIKYFHSTMSQPFRQDEFKAFEESDLWGLCTTDAFGMGLDVPDVKIVVQYRVPDNLCELWQRFGRAGRAAGSMAIGLLLVEKGYTDVEREKKADRSRKRKAKKKGQRGRPRKQQALSGPTSNIPIPRPAPAPIANPADADSNSSGSDTEDETVAPDAVPVMVVEPPTSSDFSAEDVRRAEYHNIENDKSLSHILARISKKNHRRQNMENVGRAMDDFINAPTRNIDCRRNVIVLYFGNDKASSFHRVCDPSKPDGCDRCRPQKSEICCDMCHPDSFASIAPVHIPPAPKKPSKSKNVEPSPAQSRLVPALFKWWDATAAVKLGQGGSEWGYDLFMADEIVQTICDCVHAAKIMTVDSIHNETRWRKDYVNEFGPAILKLISEILPPPVFSSTTTRREGTSGTRQVTCSACHEVGHNKSNRECKAKQARRVTADPNKENVPALESTPIHPQTPIVSTPLANLSSLRRNYSTPSQPFFPATPFPSNLLASASWDRFGYSPSLASQPRPRPRSTQIFATTPSRLGSTPEHLLSAQNFYGQADLDFFNVNRKVPLRSHIDNE